MKKYNGQVVLLPRNGFRKTDGVTTQKFSEKFIKTAFGTIQNKTSDYSSDTYGILGRHTRIR